MASDIEFRYELTGEKVTIYSIEIKGKNLYRDFYDKLNLNLQAKIDKKIELVADIGINVGDNHFSKVYDYKDQYYIKNIKPVGFRISATTFHCDRTNVILLFGWEKKVTKADKKTQRFYKRAQTIIDKIHGDPDGTKKKLRAAFKRK